MISRMRGDSLDRLQLAPCSGGDGAAWVNSDEMGTCAWEKGKDQGSWLPRKVLPNPYFGESQRTQRKNCWSTEEQRTARDTEEKSVVLCISGCSLSLCTPR